MDEHDNEKKASNDGGSSSHTPHEVAKPGEYLRAVKAHLRKGNQKEAFSLLQDAALHYPDDPFILSYYGCLQALVDKKYRAGVEKCKQALSMIKKESSFGEDMLYPVFYLNLGRAYVAAGKKKDALDAFEKGRKYDNSNRDILMELRGLGSRKKALVPFLDRSNPINKYIGLILRMSNKAPVKKR
jgi:tetratricopeptide (TPR) repeat protein